MAKSSPFYRHHIESRIAWGRRGSPGSLEDGPGRKAEAMRKRISWWLPCVLTAAGDDYVHSVRRREGRGAREDPGPGGFRAGNGHHRKGRDAPDPRRRRARPSLPHGGGGPRVFHRHPHRRCGRQGRCPPAPDRREGRPGKGRAAHPDQRGERPQNLHVAPPLRQGRAAGAASAGGVELPGPPGRGGDPRAERGARVPGPARRDDLARLDGVPGTRILPDLPQPDGRGRHDQGEDAGPFPESSGRHARRKEPLRRPEPGDPRPPGSADDVSGPR